MSTSLAATHDSNELDRGQVLIRMFMVLALYAVPVVVTLQASADPDIWWHMRVGEWVMQHGTVPQTDPFSAYGQGRPWIAYSWLFEVGVYGLYCWFGLWGMVLYQVVMAVAVTAALHWFIAQREKRFLIAIALTGISTLALAMMYKQRPWMFTILFGIMTLHVLLRWREGKWSRLAWALPFMYVLWANIHIQFVYGLCLLALGCAAPLVDRWFAIPVQQGCEAFSRRWWQLVGFAAVCALATLVTPYHLVLYRVIFEYASYQVPFQIVNELKALEFRGVCGWVMLALAGSAVFALGRRKSVSSFDILLVIVTAYFAFRARRDLWFLTLASSYILSTTRYGQAVADVDRFEMTRLRLACLAGVLLLVGFATVQVRKLDAHKLQRAVEEKYPVQAVRVVRERGYTGPLYNDFNWGGFLIWNLPELPVSLDGRTNLHGDERLIKYYRIWSGSREWRDDPELDAANVVIADRTSPLASLLEFDERFVKVHDDELAAVFVTKEQQAKQIAAQRADGNGLTFEEE